MRPSDIKTEKQLHQGDGFGVRAHRPDFIFTRKNINYCVEVELSLKSSERLEKNIKSNFLGYDFQIWVIDENNLRLYRSLQTLKIQYTNIKITNIKEVKDGTFEFIN